MRKSIGVAAALLVCAGAARAQDQPRASTAEQPNSAAPQQNPAAPQQNSAPPASAPDEAEIEKALKSDQAAQEKAHPNAPAATAPATANPAAPMAQTAPASATQSGGWASFGRFIQSMNPDLSAIVDFSAGWYSDEKVPKSGDDPAHTGFNAQEVEVALQAVVDPYFRADIFLTIPNLNGLEVEEAYLTTTHLPLNLQLKAGIFRAGLGRQNSQHLHLQDFTRRPALNAALLGVDGLRAPGLEVNWLVPKIPFYLVLAYSMFSVDPAEPDVQLQTFGGGARWDFTYVATARAFFPLGDTKSLYVGLNYAHGKTSQHSTTNCALVGVTPCVTPYDNFYDNLYGLDVYFKWKPVNVANTYRAVAWQTEFFMRQIPGVTIAEVHIPQLEGGLYTQVVAQLARRWVLGVRGEAMGIPRGDNLRTELAAAASLTWTLSEFSRIRLYGELRGPVGSASPNAMFTSGTAPHNLNGATFLQFEIAIGAHGAHPF